MAVLHAADLGAGSPDLIPGLVGRDAGGLAKPVQLTADHHAQHSRAHGVGGRLAARLKSARPSFSAR
jgi:hypothetical protein